MPTSNEPIADVPDKAEERGEKNQGKGPRRGHSPLYWLFFAGLLIIVAVIVVLVGWLPRHKRQEQIDREAAQRAKSLPRVQVVRVRRAPSASELMVPGTSQAYTEAYIYARASGYVTRRLADIGDRVREGQLLAIIDAPDLDKQVAQARSQVRQSESDLAQMEAQLHLAALNWDRYKVLVAKGVFSRQQGDQQEADYRVAEANVGAARNTVQGNRENLERLIVLQQYERVTAPFDGVITARNIDTGALITAQGTGLGVSSSPTTPGSSQAGVQGNNQGVSGTIAASNTPPTGGSQGGQMFTIADISRLRILVSVPEAYTSLVRVGQRAKLFFQEMPNENFEGRVTRTSASIDQNTRTLLVEVQLSNVGRRLLPGMYVVVNFVDIKAEPPLIVPGSAIVIRNSKTAVAAVEDNFVHFKPILIGRDYGDQTEVVNGLNEGDVIAINVSDEVRDGVKIQPELQKQSQQAGGQSDKNPAEEGQYGKQGLSDQGTKGQQQKGKKAGKK
ncbi:MAG: efflux RND transporter periplasmic adaptor subunit [Bryobacteraceae bacterium]